MTGTGYICVNKMMDWSNLLISYTMAVEKASTNVFEQIENILHSALLPRVYWA